MTKKAPVTSPDITVKGLKAGFVGTKNEMTADQKNTFRLVIRDLKPWEIHHRDLTGADEDACFSLRLAGITIRIIAHPPTSESSRSFMNSDEIREPVPFPECSRAVVDESNYLIATPQFMFKNPGGLWFTVNYARRQKKPRVIIWPNGSVDYYDVPGMQRG